MKKLAVVIYGPTGVGKTSASLSVAKRLGGEIISADSMQVYKGMNIGTAKISKEEMKGVKHHMLSIVSPNREFTVCDYVKRTKQKIDEIIARGKLPIIVGGTGLYIKALVEDYEFSGVYKDNKIRNKYNSIAKKFGNEHLHKILEEKNAERAAQINVNDTFRIVRALEIIELQESGNFVKEEKVKTKSDIEYLVFAITMDREKLYKRINARVNKMFKDGLKKEVKSLVDSGAKVNSPAMQGIGYKELISHFNKEMKMKETKELIKRRSRNYAKRQLTFMRGMNNVIEVAAGKQLAEQIVDQVKSKLEE